MAEFTTIQNLLDHQPIPEDGILTRSLFEDDRGRAVLFTFSKGQCLSEHTASSPATLQFLEGNATVTLGTETINAQAGTWIHMKPGLPHSIKTETNVTMLLFLIKDTK